jgi:hypothetical protein
MSGSRGVFNNWIEDFGHVNTELVIELNYRAPAHAKYFLLAVSSLDVFW